MHSDSLNVLVLIDAGNKVRVLVFILHSLAFLHLFDLVHSTSGISLDIRSRIPVGRLLFTSAGPSLYPF